MFDRATPPSPSEATRQSGTSRRLPHIQGRYRRPEKAGRHPTVTEGHAVPLCLRRSNRVNGGGPLGGGHGLSKGLKARAGSPGQAGLRGALVL